MTQPTATSMARATLSARPGVSRKLLARKVGLAAHSNTHWRSTDAVHG